MNKRRQVMFRTDEVLFKKIGELAKKMKINQSEVIRIGIEELIFKYADSTFKGELVVMDREKLDDFLKILYKQIPVDTQIHTDYQEQEKRRKGAEIGERIHKLNQTGKKVEAKKLREEALKQGLRPFYIPQAPELTPEEREKMLDERYPDRKRQ